MAATTDQVLDLLQQHADPRGRVSLEPEDIAVRIGTTQHDVTLALTALARRGLLQYREKHTGRRHDFTRLRLTSAVTADTAPAGNVTRPHRHKVHPVGEDALDWRRKPSRTTGGPVTTTGPQHPPVPDDALPTVHRVRLYLHRWEADRDGWIVIDSDVLAGHLGISVQDASRALSSLRSRGEAEVLKEGRRIIGVRLLERSLSRALLTGQPLAQAPRPAEQPAAAPTRPSRPATPLLDEYRAARDLAGRSRYLTFDPDPLADEALALLDWAEGVE